MERFNVKSGANEVPYPFTKSIICTQVSGKKIGTQLLILLEADHGIPAHLVVQ